MIYAPPRGGNAIELVAGFVSSAGSLLLVLVLVMLFVLIAWDHLTTGLNHDGRIASSATAGVRTRVRWRSSGAWRRSQRRGQTGHRRSAPAHVAAAAFTRPSPALYRMRARLALARLTHDWTVVRYPW